MKLLLCILLFAIGTTLRAQSLPRHKHAAVVYKNEYYVSPSGYDYSPLTDSIVGDASSSYDKAQAIYLWICQNIAYVHEGDIRTADAALDARRGVCQGFCELFFRMAETQHLNTTLVYGKVKSPVPGRPLEDHVWLLVKTEQGDILVDPTWGAGRMINGRFVRSENPMEWFDVDAEWFIFTHFPKRKQYQRMRKPVDEDAFLHLPFVFPRLQRIGISAEEALREALDGKGSYPIVYPGHEDKVRFINVPKYRNLCVNKPYTFCIEKLSDCNVYIQIGDKRIDEKQFVKTEAGMLVTVTPTIEGRLQLCAGTPTEFFTLHNPALEYRVVSEEASPAASPEDEE